MTDKTLDYQASGVSIAAQDDAIAAFKRDVESTHGPEVIAGVGAFGAAFCPDLSGYQAPVFISSTDSLGTKTILHGRFNTWQNAGRDVVGCVVNDVICSGAKPLFFLDYVALNKVVPAQIHELVGKGIAAACREIDCALIGGEIAEMRDVYQPGDFDLVGFAMGLVDRPRLLDGNACRNGSVLIGLASNGVHCNGFSLARAAFSELSDEDMNFVDKRLGESLADALLRPTICYSNAVQALTTAGILQAAAHVSGGGLQDNVPRVLPQHLAAEVSRSAVPVLPVFDLIRQQGNVAEAEMWHVFNMGIGFVLVVDPADVEKALSLTESFSPVVIGRVTEADSGERFRFSD